MVFVIRVRPGGFQVFRPDRFKYFAPMDLEARRSFNTEPCAVTPAVKDRNDDVVADHDFFPDFSCQHEHCEDLPFVMGPGGQLLPRLVALVSVDLAAGSPTCTDGGRSGRPQYRKGRVAAAKLLLHQIALYRVSWVSPRRRTAPWWHSSRQVHEPQQSVRPQLTGDELRATEVPSGNGGADKDQQPDMVVLSASPVWHDAGAGPSGIGQNIQTERIVYQPACGCDSTDRV